MPRPTDPNAPTVRTMEPEDARAVHPLFAELGYELSLDVLAARLSLVLLSDNDRVWVALDVDGQVTGFLHAYGRLSVEAPPQVTVQALVVSAAARRTGTGRRLMAAAEAWAAGCGFAFVGLCTRERRTDAHRFYESLGYGLVSHSRLYRRPLG